ncbi:MAG: ABC transporter permease [Bdellovibrionaceae bacterium]|nr:ABC transporter permease [Pseudobdellovibrionaceae bacterium]
MTTPARRRSMDLFGLPALLWFAVFLVGPLVQVLGLAFQKRGLYGGIEFVFGFQNYLRSFNPVYFEILVKSLLLASLTSVLCLAISLPLAWGMTGFSPRRKQMILIVLAVPFFMNMIARIYALKTFLHVDGPVARVLAFMGVEGDLLNLSQNFPLVMYGLVTAYLPYMLLPIWIQMEKTDPSLIESAMDLGASPWQAFRQVLVPSLRPAIASGLLLVQVPVMGEYVIPDLLGGAKTMLVGNLISEQFLKARDWPFGAALGIEMLLLLAAMSAVIMRWGRREVLR